jgi:hypothetical protein
MPAPTPAPAPTPEPTPVPAPTPAPENRGTVTLSWDAPTHRVDATLLTNLAGYRVYYGLAEGDYPNKVEVNSPVLTSIELTGLPSGTYWFVVTAYDADGLESGYSAWVSAPVG